MDATDPVLRELQLPPRQDMRRWSAERRMDSVREAIGLPGGPSQESRVTHRCYVCGPYEVVLWKPGKEAAPGWNGATYKDGHKGQNPNDMLPDIIREGVRPYAPLSFNDVFRMLDGIHMTDAKALELLACLLYRMAFMLDHGKNSAGQWKLAIPPQTLSWIAQRTGEIEGMPVEVFLYLCELIALNEDVKYHTLGHNPKMTRAVGRRNNLLTYCRLCAVLLHEEPFVEFAFGFVRGRGVSPIAEKNAAGAFPSLLGPSRACSVQS